MPANSIFEELSDEELAYENDPGAHEAVQDQNQPEPTPGPVTEPDSTVQSETVQTDSTEQASSYEGTPPKNEYVEKDVYDNLRKGLDSERIRRKETETELRQLREDMARMKGRMEGQGYDVDEDAQDVEVDPVEQLREEHAKTEAEVFRLRLTAMESQFEAKHPDYAQARDHYLETTKKSMTARGYNEDEIAQAIQQDVTTMINRAVESGTNPAQSLYDAAQVMGFQPKTRDAEEKAQQIETVQTHTQPDVQGSAPRGELTVEAAAEMSELELANLTPEQERRLWGG